MYTLWIWPRIGALGLSRHRRLFRIFAWTMGYTRHDLMKQCIPYPPRTEDRDARNNRQNVTRRSRGINLIKRLAE
jgi:hypothetical protein